MSVKYDQLKGIPIIREAGSSIKNNTGAWRTVRPDANLEKCTKCKLCWLYCPEAAITWQDGPRFDYTICKGCLICANECPAKAIEKTKEAQD